MIRIIFESKQDIDNFKQWCILALEKCRYTQSEIDFIIARYFAVRNSLKSTYPNYVDISQLTKKFKEFIKIKEKTDELDIWDRSSEMLKMRELRKEVQDFADIILDYKTKGEETRTAKGGAKLLGEKNGWKVYHITTVEAAQVMGKGTTWCITGRYEGHENEAEKWFNTYKERNKVDGYYFFIKDDFDADNPETTCDSKWCLLKSLEIPEEGDVSIIEMYNADQSVRGKRVRECSDIIHGYEIPTEFVLDEEWIRNIAIPREVQMRIKTSGNARIYEYVTKAVEEMIESGMSVEEMVEKGILSSGVLTYQYRDYLDLMCYDYIENRDYYMDILKENNINLTDEEKQEFINSLPAPYKKFLRDDWAEYLYPLYLSKKGLVDVMTFEEWEKEQASKSASDFARQIDVYLTDEYYAKLWNKAEAKVKEELTKTYLYSIDEIKRNLGIVS